MKDAMGGEGTIHIRSHCCPNRDCPSRLWDRWDIEYKDEDFKCGTCGEKLVGVFIAHKNVMDKACPFCLTRRG